MKQKIKSDETENEKTIEELLEKKRRYRRTKIILVIIIIILLLLFWMLGYKMGKIGYGDKEVSSNPDSSTGNGVSIIKVMQDDLEITKDTDINIFKNAKFDNEEIIAPRSSGSYQFCVSNEIDKDIKYNIEFVDEMDNFVNMKYKLKIDNIYIRGNENKYVEIDELNVEDVTVLRDSNNIFTLEWYWEDSDKEDTYVGSQKETQYYTLKLKIDADVFK